MTKQEKAEVVERVTCAWRTGVNTCNVPHTAGKYCAWHQHWVRMVETGNLGRQQEDEFREWWAQFQPTGLYGDRPGLWWADAGLLWQALTGVGEVPVLTDAIEKELLLRRAEYRCHCEGRMWIDPWPRLNGLPLPEWDRERWLKIIDECEYATGPSST